MTEERPEGEVEVEVEEQAPAKGTGAAGMVDTLGWGAFFIWVGIAFLAKLPLGVGLLGVGIITLAGQGARKFYGLKMEACWVFVGVCFLLAGVWELLKTKLPLSPILLILVGVALVVTAIRRNQKQGD